MDSILERKKMAIRIREIKGHTVALCAGVTEEKEGDILLGDNAHHALYNKFAVDFMSEGWLRADITDTPIRRLMLKVEEERGMI